jgi:hypothetical protein
MLHVAGKNIRRASHNVIQDAPDVGAVSADLVAQLADDECRALARSHARCRSAARPRGHMGGGAGRVRARVRAA